jgi:hypothetical protein
VRWGLDWLKKEGKRGGREKGGHGGDNIRFNGDRWRGAEGGGGWPWVAPCHEDVG